MTAFQLYARYYDLLYRDKDYIGEAEFVNKRLGGSLECPGHILELGCGTGRHAVELTKFGWSVTGYDISPEMLEKAKRRASDLALHQADRLTFRLGDVRSIEGDAVYDCAISLFHVMSYLTCENDFRSTLRSTASHVKESGKFYFDFWYGAAVLSNPPMVRVKRLEDEHTKVTRTAEPILDFNRNLVEVNYEITIVDKKTEAITQIRENHFLRYWFLPELESLLSSEGFELLASGRHGETQPLGSDSWYGWILAKKV